MTNPSVQVNVCSGTPWEVERVRSLILTEQGSVYVEIGSFRGGSLKAFGSAMDPGSLLVGVDDRLLPDMTAMANELNGRFDCRTIKGDSHTQAVKDRLEKELSGRRIDVLFVDGDHSPDGCRRDLDLYVPMVRPGGLVLMHDCGGPEPDKPVLPKVAKVLAGLHRVWLERSAGKKRVLIQQWCGYGGWWQ